MLFVTRTHDALAEIWKTDSSFVTLSLNAAAFLLQSQHGTILSFIRWSNGEIFECNLSPIDQMIHFLISPLAHSVSALPVSPGG